MENDVPEFFKEKDIFGFDKPVLKVDNEPLTKDFSNDLTVVYATLGSRIIAKLLDALILIIPVIILDVVMFGPEFTNPENSFKRNLLNLALWAVYYGFMESSEQQATLGKRICGLKVIDEFGNRLTYRKAILRYLAIIISVLPLGFGIWAIAYDKKKQGWHDALLGCYVVKSKFSNIDNQT